MNRNVHFLKGLIAIVFAIGIGPFSSQAQSDSVRDEEPYPYTTILKGGYSILFKVDNSLQYLYLKRGARTITELISTSKGMPYKNLGYVAADFNDYFVLAHSFGSGNPHYIELIRKVSGKNVIKEGAALIDVYEKLGFLLYSDNDVPGKKDKMTLYNIQTGQKQFFSFPEDIFGEPEILNRIKISNLTGKQLVIKYRTGKGVKTKGYTRP